MRQASEDHPTMMNNPRGSKIASIGRKELLDSLDFYPTPPWATRSLCEHVIGDWKTSMFAADPCAGGGHMSEVLKEYFKTVRSSDVWDYGRGDRIGSYMDEGLNILPSLKTDWVITNPPFRSAVAIARRALREARLGVAMLCRLQWAESRNRYDLFTEFPLWRIAVFSDRVSMTKGQWKPVGPSAVAYAWFVWKIGYRGSTELTFIPPGRREALTRPTDVPRFTGSSVQ